MLRAPPTREGTRRGRPDPPARPIARSWRARSANAGAVHAPLGVWRDWGGGVRGPRAARDAEAPRKHRGHLRTTLAKGVPPSAAPCSKCPTHARLPPVEHIWHLWWQSRLPSSPPCPGWLTATRRPHPTHLCSLLLLCAPSFPRTQATGYADDDVHRNLAVNNRKLNEAAAFCDNNISTTKVRARKQRGGSAEAVSLSGTAARRWLRRDTDPPSLGAKNSTPCPTSFPRPYTSSSVAWPMCTS